MFVFASIGTVLAGAALQAADWPSFRGPQGNGVASEERAPLEWSQDKNVKWKAKLPQPGNGSPIVSQGSVFVACAEDDKGLKRSLYCFDRRNGSQRWVRTVDYGKESPTHETNPYCGTTPAADGRFVVVWHDSAGLYCYDFQGQQQWSQNLGEFRHMWGHGTSPVIYRDRVIMHCGPGQKVFLTAIDLASGKTFWSTEEPIEGDGESRPDKKYMGSWTTPIIARINGRDQVICPLPTRVVAYDPADGKIIWSCDGTRGPKGDLAYSSPVIAGDVCVVIGGFNGPGMGIRLGGTGNITEKDRLWRNETNPQSIGTGVALDGVIYRPNAGPGLTGVECLDPSTGKVLWSSREAGSIWGSIVLAAGRAYVTNQTGATIVFRPNRERFDLLAKNDLGEASNATPAVSDGEIFLRTNQHVYCIAER
jgi:outer membrane protein assembly factor BamB